MSNGSLASSTFTPNAGATTTQITFTVNMTKKNNWHSLDNVVLTGTLSCTDTDGDGVCDDDEVDGCTDNTACNYNTAATDDDGTCTYATGCDYCSGATDGTGTVVDGSALTPFEFTLTVDNYPEEIAWYMVDDDASSTLIWGTGGSTSNPTEFIASEVADGATLVYEQCFDPSGSYTLFISDTYGDGLLGTSSGGTPGWTLVVGSGAGTTVSNVVAPIDINIGSPNEISIDFGCTDSGAGNFDSNANVDDGSCTYPGCTDASACNYDASASTDDGSCTYATTWYEDSDSDNAGDPNSTTTSCTQPAGYVAVAGDECPSDGSLQTAPTWYEDSDGDNAGDPNSTTTSCTQPAGYVAVAGDGCPTDPNKTSAGACGCGTADTDTDSDGTPDCNDTDDDNDGVLDGADTAPLDPDVCADADGDGCDDCSIGTDGFGSLADNTPDNDGTDFDGDGLCDSGDPDDDNDGALDANDSDDNNANVCSDTDNDGCDDCANGSYDPANDGTDTDGDGLCNSGDPDDDGDGVLDGADSAPLNPNVCSDTDGDGCDDCANGSYDPDNDGTDTDGDGTCDSGDGCPNDPLKTSAGICGCGNVDVDNNSNGICDTEECIDSANPVAATNDTTLYLDASGAASVMGLGDERWLYRRLCHCGVCLGRFIV